MLWLTGIVVLIIISTLWVLKKRGGHDPLAEPAIAMILGALIIIIGLGTFLETQHDVVEMETFWYINQDVYTEAIKSTRAALIRNTADPVIQLENMQHSTMIAARIRELRDRVVEYNIQLTLYRRWENFAWLLRPVLQYPNEECQLIMLADPPQ